MGIGSLVVFGPDRLPETVRATGLWVGRLKRSLLDTRAELEQQIGADEIRQQLNREEVTHSIKATCEEIDRVRSEIPEFPPAPAATADDTTEGESAEM